MSLPNEVNLQLLASSASYTINQSLRFRASASAYLNRTPGSASNRTTWTLSFWTKRGILGGDRIVFNAGTTGSSDIDIFFPSDQFMISDRSGWQAKTTQLFRDTSAWYHFVVALDTTQATDTNRIKMYVNGTQITSFASPSYPAQNATSSINNNVGHLIGTRSLIDNLYDGYLTEMNFIDGQALTPSSFGQTDSQTGVWQPKKYGGTYGTNGFYLNFSDNSAVTAAALGKDSSGNGNNWTPNNISLTAGTTYDWMRDSPTLGTLASNYATLNPLDKLGSSGFPTTTNGNLRVTPGNTVAASTIPLPTTGKWYWEATLSTGQYPEYGLARTTSPGGGSSIGVFGVYYNGTNVWLANSSDGITDGNHAINSGDIGLVAVDVDNNKLWLGRSRSGTIVWAGGGNPATGASPTFSASGGGGVYATTFNALTWCFPLFASGGGSDVWDANFGQQAWVYTPPTGYKALNTYNLPTPTIGATSATQASKYFNIGLWTSNNSASNIPVTGLGFQPSFFWGKLRGSNTNHRLVDAIRGVTKMVNSNTLVAESTETDAFASFDSDGFTIGQDTTGGGLNFSTSSGIGWCWNGGSSTATNNNGSISSQVRANPTAGFSVVSYTLNNSTFTVGHGLNAAPNFMLVKGRDASNNWDVYHSSVGAGYRLVLNDGSNPSASSQVWNNTAPTSTVFSGDSAWWNNPSTNKMIAFCWTAIPGYSAFGLYTGNGASDGTFVYTGFRPKYVLVKATNMAGTRWELFDTTRSTINPSNNRLSPSESAAEVTGYNSPDILSNGFKFRGAAGYTNDSGTTYIYAAFAESPFKYALAR